MNWIVQQVKRLKAIGLILLISALSACNSHKPCEVCPAVVDPVCGDDGIPYTNACEAHCAGVGYTSGYCEEEADALMLDLGSIATDGCDYMLLIGQEYYHPGSLDSIWYQDSLPVHIHFKRTLQLFYCGLANTPYGVIEVLDIALR